MSKKLYRGDILLDRQLIEVHFTPHYEALCIFINSFTNTLDDEVYTVSYLHPNTWHLNSSNYFEPGEPPPNFSRSGYDKADYEYVGELTPLQKEIYLGHLTPTGG